MTQTTIAESSMNVTIEGNVSKGFERVADVFADLWGDIEVGASCCIFHEGKKVVDIWGGYINREMTVPWRSDTLINVYSSTKGMGSLSLAILVDDGLVDLTRQTPRKSRNINAHWKTIRKQIRMEPCPNSAGPVLVSAPPSFSPSISW